MARKTPSPPICHDCGIALVRDTRPLKLVYLDQSTTIDQPGWYCPKCGEGVVEREDLLASRPERAELKARAEGVLSPSEVKRIRTKLKLSQRAAGEILGGGLRAFQKYESGEVAVSQAMSNLLRLLDRDPKRLSEIEAHLAA